MNIEIMPRLLEEAHLPLPMYMEVAYAALVLRRILGRGHLDHIENQVLDRLYLQELHSYIDGIQTDPEAAAPPINRMFFEEVVAYVIGHLSPDGFLDYATPSFELKRTDHPRSVACRLAEGNPFVTESHVRRAHAVLIERGSREATFKLRQRRKQVSYAVAS